MFVKCGSRDETSDTNGISHFLEHLHYMGTPNRSRFKIKREISANQANLEITTERENTCFEMVLPSKNLKWSVEIIADVMLNSKCDVGYIQYERERVLQDIIESKKKLCD